MSQTDLQNVWHHGRCNALQNTCLQNARQVFGFISNVFKKEKKTNMLLTKTNCVVVNFGEK